MHIRMQNVILGMNSVSFGFALTNAPIATLLAFLQGLVHPKLTFLYYLLTLNVIPDLCDLLFSLACKRRIFTIKMDEQSFKQKLML